MVHDNRASGYEKKLLLALAAVALAAAALAAVFVALRARRVNGAESYPKASISWDGAEVAVLDLGEYTDSVVLTMAQFGADVPVSFELKDHRIRFVDVDCPDKLCEGFGFIGAPMQTAVRMPNRVSVSIVD